MPIRFDDRVAIVTGSGAGLGKLACAAAGEPRRQGGGQRPGRSGRRPRRAAMPSPIRWWRKSKRPAARRWRTKLRRRRKSAQGIIDTAEYVGPAGHSGEQRWHPARQGVPEHVDGGFRIHLAGALHRHGVLHQGRVADHAPAAIWPGRRHDFGFGHRRQFRPEQLRCGENGGERPDQRAAVEGAKVQYPVQRDSPSAHTRMTEGLCRPTCAIHAARTGFAGGRLAVQRGLRHHRRDHRRLSRRLRRVQYHQSEGVQFDPEPPVTLDMFAAKVEPDPRSVEGEAITELMGTVEVQPAEDGQDQVSQQRSF